MPLIFGSYLAGALLTCLVPISLLICFATYFYRNWRKLPENATPESSAATSQTAAGPAGVGSSGATPGADGVPAAGA